MPLNPILGNRYFIVYKKGDIYKIELSTYVGAQGFAGTCFARNGKVRKMNIGEFFNGLGWVNTLGTTAIVSNRRTASWVRDLFESEPLSTSSCTYEDRQARRRRIKAKVDRFIQIISNTTN